MTEFNEPKPERGVQIISIKVGDTMTGRKGGSGNQGAFATGFLQGRPIETMVVLLRQPLRSDLRLRKSTLSASRSSTRSKLDERLEGSGFYGISPIVRSQYAERAEQELKRQYLTAASTASLSRPRSDPLERNRRISKSVSMKAWQPRSTNQHRWKPVF